MPTFQASDFLLLYLPVQISTTPKGDGIFMKEKLGARQLQFPVLVLFIYKEYTTTII